MGVPDISMEVVGNRKEMYREGERLAKKFGSYATIKVPCTPDGLAVCRQLKKLIIRVNVTLIFFSNSIRNKPLPFYILSVRMRHNYVRVKRYSLIEKYK